MKNEIEQWQEDPIIPWANANEGSIRDVFPKVDVNKFRSLVNPMKDEKDTNKNIQGIPEGDD